MAAKKKFHEVPPESHASELLANERTFLAWLRTSITILSFGFAVIKFDAWAGPTSQGAGNAGASAHLAGSLGSILIILGGAMSAVGAFHYIRTNRQVLEGKVQTSNWLVLAIAASVVTLSIAVIIYLAAHGEY